MCLYACLCVCHDSHVEARKQLGGVGSLLPQCGSLGSNSGHPPELRQGLQTVFELQSSCLCPPRTRITEIWYYTCQSKAFLGHCCRRALWEELVCAFLTPQSSVPWTRCSERHALLVHILSEPEKLKQKNCDQGRIEGHQGLRGRLAPSNMGEGITSNPKQPFLHFQGNRAQSRLLSLEDALKCKNAACIKHWSQSTSIQHCGLLNSWTFRCARLHPCSCWRWKTRDWGRI